MQGDGDACGQETRAGNLTLSEAWSDGDPAADTDWELLTRSSVRCLLPSRRVLHRAKGQPWMLTHHG
jgi:hypothetical protein